MRLENTVGEGGSLCKPLSVGRHVAGKAVGILKGHTTKDMPLCDALHRESLVAMKRKDFIKVIIPQGEL